MKKHILLFISAIIIFLLGYYAGAIQLVPLFSTQIPKSNSVVDTTAVDSVEQVADTVVNVPVLVESDTVSGSIERIENQTFILQVLDTAASTNVPSYRTAVVSVPNGAIITKSESTVIRNGSRVAVEKDYIERYFLNQTSAVNTVIQEELETLEQRETPILFSDIELTDWVSITCNANSAQSSSECEALYIVVSAR